jgi:hypothetical protein
MAVPWHVSAVLTASFCVLIGVLWDISWHQSIGRDTFFSPPHVAIYLGGVMAGISCGLQVLRISFAGSPAEHAASVRYWHYFRGPLGAWVAIWGALAMITSAPFDDWWHNAYGLDTKILSPPHALLAAGIGAINVGALLLVTPLQNRSDAARQRALARLCAVSFGLVLLMVAIIVSEYHYRVYMHGTRFYRVAAIAFPVVLAAAAVAIRMRWPATAVAAVYGAVTLGMMWILPLFPAEPMLAPIHQQVTHMVPPSFPLLLIVPAFLMDVLVRRFGGVRRDTLLAVVIGAVFVLSFMAVQYPFASFLMSDGAQNPIFAGNNFPYQVAKTTYYFRRLFLPEDANAADFVRGAAAAVVYAMLSARVGLAWGRWLQRVER